MINLPEHGSCTENDKFSLRELPRRGRSKFGVSQRCQNTAVGCIDLGPNFRSRPPSYNRLCACPCDTMLQPRHVLLEAFSAMRSGNWREFLAGYKMQRLELMPAEWHEQWRHAYVRGILVWQCRRRTTTDRHCYSFRLAWSPTASDTLPPWKLRKQYPRLQKDIPKPHSLAVRHLDPACDMRNRLRQLTFGHERGCAARLLFSCGSRARTSIRHQTHGPKKWGVGLHGGRPYRPNPKTKEHGFNDPWLRLVLV